MNYGTIKNFDIANGPGCRVSLFVSGCTNDCPGCFNEEAQDFDYGEPFTDETLNYILELLDNPNIAGLSILGGDPFHWRNIDTVTHICEVVRERFGDDKTIWAWSGYLYSDLQHLNIMQYLDVLVDGPFVERLKNLTLPYAGSSNQRVIDVQVSQRARTVVLWDR